MASHLTVTNTTAAGVSTTRGFGTPAGGSADTEGGLMGAFAALLGGAIEGKGPTSTTTQSGELNLANLVELSFGFGGDSEQPAEDPEAIAAVIDAVLPIQTSPEAAAAIEELTALIDGLADLKASMDAGEPIDPELLKRLDANLESLTAALDIELGALPPLTDLTALVTNLSPEDGGIAAQLTTALAPLAQTLVAGTTQTSDAAAELAPLIKSIGDKLAALLQALNNGEIDATQLADLGLDADLPLDAEIEAALARLAAPAVKVEATPNAVVLAAPSLKITEPVLTGKANVEVAAGTAPEAVADAVPTDTAEAVLQVSADAGTDTESGGRPGEQPAEVKVEAKAAPVAAAPVEDVADVQASTLTQHQASRIDAAAAPRVIQAGYQTSQQQLNLPQLAFELVRQVNDGNTRFQMRLDPPELGKIDVRLDIDASGQVNARMTVEKAETLDLMQRDQRALERALQQAGLDSAKTNLEFSLKQNPFSGGQQGQGGNGRQPLFGEDGTAQADDLPPTTVNLYRGSLTASGVNIIA